MRTAEEILRSVYNEDDSQEDNLQLAITLNPSLDLIKQAINEARIEAIKESADLCDETEDNRFEHKQYILKIIDQIK